jgi:hypothetical protein
MNTYNPLQVCLFERTRFVLLKLKENRIKWSEIEGLSILPNFETVKI